MSPVFYNVSSVYKGVKKLNPFLGVILRERPNGKKHWSAIRIKFELAEQLAYLGKPVVESDSDVACGSSDETEVEEDQQDRLRLRRNVLHVPGVAAKRLDCRVHMQRKATRFRCMTCQKPICSSNCWIRYHKKRRYLFNDSECSGKIVNAKNLD